MDRDPELDRFISASIDAAMHINCALMYEPDFGEDLVNLDVDEAYEVLRDFSPEIIVADGNAASIAECTIRTLDEGAKTYVGTTAHVVAYRILSDFGLVAKVLRKNILKGTDGYRQWAAARDALDAESKTNLRRLGARMQRELEILLSSKGRRSDEEPEGGWMDPMNKTELMKELGARGCHCSPKTFEEWFGTWRKKRVGKSQSWQIAVKDFPKGNRLTGRKPEKNGKNGS